MSVAFVRRYTSEPGTAEILAVEGVVVIDREPPASITGIGSGTVCMVGEFEDGPFAATEGIPSDPTYVRGPSEVSGGGDLARRFGGFGFSYDGVVSSNPCARTRLADGAVVKEHWNGNGFVALASKKFARLIVARVDTSVGSVTFNRLAQVTGVNAFSYDLEPGQTVVVDLGAGPLTATFTAVAATIVSGVGTYPSTFVGGETLTFAIDGTPYTATFLASDQTQTQVIDRLNAAAGFTAFTNAGPGANDTTLTGRVRGTGGSVQIVSGTALVLTQTGFVAGAAVAGTGNVSNVDKVTSTEAHTVIVAAAVGTRTERDSQGRIRIVNTATPSTGTITVTAASTATAFGFPLGVANSAATGGVDGTIPAGTRVRTAGGLEWVTMQTLSVTAASAGPYTVKVRPGLDDGSVAGTGAGTASVMPFGVDSGAWAVQNLLPLTAALTEAAIDAAYVAAIDSTLSVSGVTKEINVIVAARQSNAVRTRLRSNAISASGNGAYGRMAVVRPPLKSTRAVAKSTSAQPGVGAYRHERVVYAFPGAAAFLPEVAARGLSGGEGFTYDGVVDTGFDSWVASILSQLAPEENPGQETPFIGNIVAVERGNADVQSLTMEDYISFRASGIAALRIDGGDVCVQSGVTSVDPLVTPNLRNIARRRMADFIQDTLALRLSGTSKRLATRLRKAQMLSEINAFMSQLLSADNPAAQRIDSYLIDGKSGNAKNQPPNIFRIILKVRTLASLDAIVLDSTIGENVVTVTEQLAA
jgi:hypothetical protein